MTIRRMFQRRGTAAEWSTANPILGAGEIGIELGAVLRLKIGDGTTAWNTLPYAAIPASVATAFGLALLGTADAAAARSAIGAEAVANKNQPNGYMGLGSDGKAAAAQLPSYVDDVLEYANLAAFPGTGETGKIYVAIDTNKPYRWSGSTYVEISPSPGSTDSVTEGSVNLYYTNARADARIPAASHAATSKTTPVDADEIPLVDSAASNGLKKLTWANAKAAFKSYYDSVTATLTNKTIQGASLTGATSVNPGDVVRFGHANETNGDDGKIAAGIFTEGLNIVGTQTVAGHGRKVAVYGTLVDAADGGPYAKNSYIDGLYVNSSRLVGSTAGGGTGAEDGANTWTKIATFQSPGSYPVVSTVLGVTSTSIPATAIIAMTIRQTTSPTVPDISVDVLGAGSTGILAGDSFKVIAGAFGAPVELWMKKISAWGVFNVYELVSCNGGFSVTYHWSAPWQSTEPVGAGANVRSNGVTAFGSPVVTTADVSNQITNSTIPKRLASGELELKLATYPTASRPSASGSTGRTLYDTTLHKPIYSDGTNWRDAAGTVV